MGRIGDLTRAYDLARIVHSKMIPNHTDLTFRNRQPDTERGNAND